MVVLFELTEEDFVIHNAEFLRVLNLNLAMKSISKIFISLPNSDIKLQQHSKLFTIFNKDLNLPQFIELCKKRSGDDVYILSNPLSLFNSEIESIKNFDLKRMSLSNPGKFYVFHRITKITTVENSISLSNEIQQIDFGAKSIKFWNLEVVAKNNKQLNTSEGNFTTVRHKGVVTNTTTISNRRKKLDVVIVSVDYNDYLILTLNHNSKIFERITVVTSKSDTLCQQICSKIGIKCISTDEMYSNGDKFNKGKAINFGINSIVDPDFILILDADIIVEKPINLDELEEDALYISDRKIIHSFSEYEKWSRGESFYFDSEPPRGFGFFQLFNFNNPVVNRREVFPVNYEKADGSDLVFRNKFLKRTNINNSILHLGPAYKNWTGRKSERFVSEETLDELIKKTEKREIVETIKYKTTKTNDWGISRFEELNQSKYGSFKIDNSIIVDYHRTGWKKSISSLSKINNQTGKIFNCFLEETYCWTNSIKKIYQEEWYGILHNPIGCPKEYLNKNNVMNIFEVEEFYLSLKCCKGLFVLSQSEKIKVEREIKKLGLNIPINALKHPFYECRKKWSIEKYNVDKKIIHIGWWLRNLQTFYDLDCSIQKIRIKLNEKIESNLKKSYNDSKGNTSEIDYLSNEDYDDLLTSSVVFIDLIDAVACNTIIECIERGVPIIVNKIESVIDYLGEDYPMYMEENSNIEDLLSEEILISTTQYLNKIKKPLDLGRQIERSEIYKKLSKASTLFLPNDLDESEGGIYNPGFTEFENRKLFFPRIEKFSEKERSKNELWKNTSSSTKIIEVDDSFNLINILDLSSENYTGNRIEDFRLFSHKGRLYTNHIFVDDNSIYPVLSEIDLDSNKFKILGKIDLDIEINKVEKNWIFWSNGEVLYLFYKLNPMMVFEVDLENMEAKTVKNLKNDINWDFGEYISFSTNPIIIDEGLLIGFHSRSKDLIYHQGLALLDKDFNVIKYNKEPYLSGGDFDGVNKNVIYTTSLLEKGDSILCFSGDGDFKSIIYKINKSDLWIR